MARRPCQSCNVLHKNVIPLVFCTDVQGKAVGVSSVCVALGAPKYHALPRLSRLKKTKLPIKHDTTATLIWKGRVDQRNGRADVVASCAAGPMKRVHTYFDREVKVGGSTTERCRGRESHVLQLGPRHGWRDQAKCV